MPTSRTSTNGSRPKQGAPDVELEKRQRLALDQQRDVLRMLEGAEEVLDRKLLGLAQANPLVVSLLSVAVFQSGASSPVVQQSQLGTLVLVVVLMVLQLLVIGWNWRPRPFAVPTQPIVNGEWAEMIPRRYFDVPTLDAINHVISEYVEAGLMTTRSSKEKAKGIRIAIILFGLQLVALAGALGIRLAAP